MFVYGFLSMSQVPSFEQNGHVSTFNLTLKNKVATVLFLVFLNHSYSLCCVQC